MAFDLVVEKSTNQADHPFIIDGIEFYEVAMIQRLHKKHGGILLMHLSNPFSDFTLSLEILKESKEHLFELMTNAQLVKAEKAFVFKITAIVCFAIDNSLMLHGVAD